MNLTLSERLNQLFGNPLHRLGRDLSPKVPVKRRWCSSLSKEERGITLEHTMQHEHSASDFPPMCFACVLVFCIYFLCILLASYSSSLYSDVLFTQHSLCLNYKFYLFIFKNPDAPRHQPNFIYSIFKGTYLLKLCHVLNLISPNLHSFLLSCIPLLCTDTTQFLLRNHQSCCFILFDL